MWILVVVAGIHGYSNNHSSLDGCIQEFELTRPVEVEEAYCMNTNGEVVYLIPPPSKRSK
jgi:hypothetical protein